VGWFVGFHNSSWVLAKKTADMFPSHIIPIHRPIILQIGIASRSRALCQRFELPIRLDHCWRWHATSSALLLKRHRNPENIGTIIMVLVTCFGNSGALRKKLVMLLHPLFQLSSSRNSLQETPGEKPEGSRAARVVGAALEPSGFYPGVSQREVRELEKVGGAT
jgi:hypothetical protein